MNIVVIGLSHHSSPVELRERFAFAESKIPEALKSLRESGIAGEAVILSTCNRVEIYAATALEPAQAFAELKKYLVKRGSFSLLTPAIRAHELYTLAEPQSLHHFSRSHAVNGLDGARQPKFSASSKKPMISPCNTSTPARG